MATNRSGNRPQGQPLSVKEVRLDQVGRGETTLKGRVAGKVARGDKPAEGVSIILLVGGIQTPNSPLQTNGDGEVSDDFMVPLEPEINRITIEARGENGWPSGRRQVDVPLVSGPKKKNIDKVSIDASGERGDYIVSVIVSAEDRTPIEGVEVTILDGKNAHKGKTDVTGSVNQPIVFNEPSRRITVQVPGEKSQKLHLLGKKPELEIPIGLSFGRKFWFKLTKSNDFRLGILWLVTLVLLTYNVFATSSNISTAKENATVRERKPTSSEILRDRLASKGMLQNYSQKAKKEKSSGIPTCWKVTFLILFVSVVYTPIAKREEMAYAISKVRTRTSSWEDLPDILTAGETPSGTQTKTPGGASRSKSLWVLLNAWIFLREFIAAISGDLMSGRRK